ncbi:MAG: hypothetical protein KA493_00830 [Fusobacteriaceae bacterium]|nr:hypothetical protein [Fusobacteriaceae bacterium]
MKKLLLMSILVSAMAFGATTPTPATTAVAPKTAAPMMNNGQCNMGGSPMMKGDYNMMGPHGNMKQYFSEEENATIIKNNDEIRKLTSSEKPDWNKIGKLNEENAKIMSKAKTKMMQATHNNVVNTTPPATVPATTEKKAGY